MLADLGLVQAIEHRLDAVERRAGITARRVVAGEVTLPRAVEKVFYYITQEALNNALKHADATEVTVRVTQQRARTELVVLDNGHGFDVDAVAGPGGSASSAWRAGHPRRRLGGGWPGAPRRHPGGGEHPERGLAASRTRHPTGPRCPT